MIQTRFSAFTIITLVIVLGTTSQTKAQVTTSHDAKSAHPSMAPLEQYLMDRDAEIALARSAAPESISGDAEVMVLGRKGFEIAEGEKLLRVHGAAIVECRERRS